MRERQKNGGRETGKKDREMANKDGNERWEETQKDRERGNKDGDERRDENSERRKKEDGKVRQE